MTEKYALVRAIKPKDAMGQPKARMAAAGLKVDGEGNYIDGQKVVMGYLFGTATAVHVAKRARPTGDGVDEFVGLRGNFEALSFEKDKPGAKSALIYLAAHIQDIIIPLLKDQGPDKPPNDGQEGRSMGAETVSFAFEVAVLTRKSVPTGFVWEYVPAVEPSTTDPLAHLRQALLPAPAKADPEPVQVTEEGEAVEDEKPHGKRHKAA